MNCPAQSDEKLGMKLLKINDIDVLVNFFDIYLALFYFNL